MIINCLKRGGRERRVLELAKGLALQKGYEIFLVSLSDIVEYEYVYQLPIRFEIIQKKDKDISLIFKIRKLIKSFQPDIIHSWDVMSSGYITAANVFLNKPVVNGVIYDAAVDSSFYDRGYFKVRLFAHLSKATVANSKAGLSAYKTPRRKSHVIYNGIDLKRFDNLAAQDALARDILGQEKGNLFIGAMVASLNKWKDHDTLLKAAVRLCQKHDRFTLLVIGDGPEMERHMASVPKELLNKRIHFLGSRTDIESILQLIDVGLLITPREGLSNAIIEYMASSKPVIASRGGGTEELVKDGETGFLVDQKDTNGIIEQVERLMNNPELGRALGQQGRQWIQDNFEIGRMADAYIHLYETLLPKRNTKMTLSVK